jgi:hypothetical protein
MNLELYINLYLNAIKKPRHSNGWERVLGVISGKVLRCKHCKALFSSSAEGQEQFNDHEMDFHNEYFPRNNWKLDESPYIFELIKGQMMCLIGCRFNVCYKNENDLRKHYVLWHSEQELAHWGYDR